MAKPIRNTPILQGRDAIIFILLQLSHYRLLRKSDLSTDYEHFTLVLVTIPIYALYEVSILVLNKSSRSPETGDEEDEDLISDYNIHER